MYEYNALITRVVDGDTFDAEVDLGFRVKWKARFRLKNVDTPEIWRPTTEAEWDHGEKASDFVKEKIEGKVVRLVSYKAGIYNRYGCEVYVDGKSLSDLLIENGLEKLSSYPAD